MLDSLRAGTSAPAANRAGATEASFAAARGDRAAAERLIGRVLESGYMDHHVAYSLGVAYAQLGRRAEALQWLERAVQAGFPCYPWFQRDALLEPFRRDPSARPFFGRLKAQWEAAKARYHSTYS
jgi:tetratricopeptide (TPR) repeat protein